MDRTLEQREVICTVVLTLVSQNCVIFILLFAICSDLGAERRPLFTDALESFDGYPVQKDTGKELARELKVLHYVERLLEHVEASAH